MTTIITLEASFRVAQKVAEAINDNPFFVENVNHTDYNFFEFNEEIEGEIKSCMEVWGIDLNELEFKTLKNLSDDNETFGIPEGMDKETYYNQYK